jgi:hypothetical protein
MLRNYPESLAALQNLVEQYDGYASSPSTIRGQAENDDEPHGYQNIARGRSGDRFSPVSLPYEPSPSPIGTAAVHAAGTPIMPLAGFENYRSAAPSPTSFHSPRPRIVSNSTLITLITPASPAPEEVHTELGDMSTATLASSGNTADSPASPPPEEVHTELGDMSTTTLASSGSRLVSLASQPQSYRRRGSQDQIARPVSSSPPLGSSRSPAVAGYSPNLYHIRGHRPIPQGFDTLLSSPASPPIPGYQPQISSETKKYAPKSGSATDVRSPFTSGVNLPRLSEPYDSSQQVGSVITGTGTYPAAHTPGGRITEPIDIATPFPWLLEDHLLAREFVPGDRNTPFSQIQQQRSDEYNPYGPPIDPNKAFYMPNIDCSDYERRDSGVYQREQPVRTSRWGPCLLTNFLPSWEHRGYQQDNHGGKRPVPEHPSRLYPSPSSMQSSLPRERPGYQNHGLLLSAEQPSLPQPSRARFSGFQTGHAGLRGSPSSALSLSSPTSKPPDVDSSHFVTIRMKTFHAWKTTR